MSVIRSVGRGGRAQCCFDAAVAGSWMPWRSSWRGGGRRQCRAGRGCHRWWRASRRGVEEAVGEGGRGPYATDALSAGLPSPLRATAEVCRLELGEPDYAGGCCGFLTAALQRFGEIVQWSGWKVPRTAHTAMPYSPPPRELHFEASQYDAEVARAEADRWWQVHP